MNYLLLAALWFIYFVIHSVLASDHVKVYFEKVFKGGFRFYRIIYSLISTIGLLVILLFNASITSELLFENTGWIRYVSLMLATLGVIIISRSFREYHFASFVGWKEESNDFKKTGILKYVRHPIYSGTILIVVGFFLFVPTLASLISTCCTMAYLPVGIFLEERKLINQFGDRYLTYKKEVPSIFPRLRR